MRSAAGRPGRETGPAANLGDGRFECHTGHFQGENAHQSTDGGRAVACQGIVRNEERMRSELGVPAGARPAEVLLAAWRRWGVDSLARIDGVVALVLRDGDDLFLYRDPSGLSNLYYHAGPKGRIAFATCLEDLLRLPGVTRRVARKSVHEYLRFLDISAPNTWFEGVASVEPGCVVRASGTDVQTLPLGTAAPIGSSALSFEAAVDRLDSLLNEAVRADLAAAKAPAAFLSGGVDSSLLCAIGERHRPDLTAVTVGFDDKSIDEAPAARRIAAHLGLKHSVLQFGRVDQLAAFDRLSRGIEQPMADPATLATLLAFEHCLTRFDAVLDGTGADEIVGATPPRHLRWAVGTASRVPARLRRALAHAMRRTPVLAGYAPIVDFEHPALTLIRWQGFQRSEIEELCGEPVDFAHTQFFRTFERFPRSAHFERYTALMNAMPCDRLNQAMLVSGLDPRFPFWDRETVSFIGGLNRDFRDAPNHPKRLLRALLARYVPSELWDRPKHGFVFPLAEFLAADDFLVVRRHLDQDRWRQAGVLSATAVHRYAQGFIAGDRSLAMRVWALAVLGAWLEAHGAPRAT